MPVGTDLAFTGAVTPSAAVTAGAAELAGTVGTAEAAIIWEAITTEVAGTLGEAVADARLGCIVALQAVQAWLHRVAVAVRRDTPEEVAVTAVAGMAVEVTAAIGSRQLI
jgi:hypothetical protein